MRQVSVSTPPPCIRLARLKFKFNRRKKLYCPDCNELFTEQIVGNELFTEQIVGIVMVFTSVKLNGGFTIEKPNILRP